MPGDAPSQTLNYLSLQKFTGFIVTVAPVNSCLFHCCVPSDDVAILRKTTV